MTHFSVLCLLNNKDDLAVNLSPYDENDHLTETKTYPGGETHTYNPNAQWDGWTIGGRGSNSLLNKKGEFVNETYVGNYDILNTQKKAFDKAEQSWDIWHKLYKDLPEALSFQEILDKTPAPKPDPHSEEQNPQVLRRNLVREIYSQQPRIEKARAVNGFFYDHTVFTYQNFKRGDYLDYSRETAIPGYAFLKYGEWIDPGAVSWFGHTASTFDSERSLGKLMLESIQQAPIDHHLVLVDCHI